MSSKVRSAFTSARLKIDRADDHIAQISKLLRDTPPFRCVATTNAKANWRTIGPKRDKAAVDALALVCGDAAHNLRTALDHAYAAVVFPHLPHQGLRKTVQFPFSKTANGLGGAINTRQGHKIGPEFVKFLTAIAPHGESGGNRVLYAIHAIDTPDKHFRLVVATDHTFLPASRIREIFPEFPTESGDNFASEAGGWFEWNIHHLTMNEWITLGVPKSGILETYVDIPVSVGIHYGHEERAMPLVPMFHQMRDATHIVISEMERFL